MGEREKVEISRYNTGWSVLGKRFKRIGQCMKYARQKGFLGVVNNYNWDTWD